jgi:3-hydroxybutyryl-CoA dehydratase
LTLARHRFSDLSVGMKAEFEAFVTTEMMDLFAKISGDVNPLHVSSSFAKEHGFNDRVVYGLLTTSFYSKLVGHYLPGENALLHAVDVSFVKPVYVGAKLRVLGEIAYLNEAFKQIEIAASILNGDGLKVSRAKIKAGCHE